MILWQVSESGGNTFTVTALDYDEHGRQRKKTTTYRLPDGVTPGKAEKLAKAFAAKQI